MINTDYLKSSFYMILKVSHLTHTVDYFNMKIIRIIILLFITLILPFLISINALFADDFYGISDVKKELITLSDNTTLNVEVKNTWNLSRDSNNNALLSYINVKTPLIVTILNNVVPYKTAAGLNQYITLHEEEAIKLIPNNGNIQRGYDQILNVKVPFIMILEEAGDKKTVHKILYPYNKDKVFVIVTSITGAAPMKDTEELLNSIVLSILKEATGH